VSVGKVPFLARFMRSWVEWGERWWVFRDREEKMRGDMMGSGLGLERRKEMA
jgi:hypothetical protein